MSVIGADVGGTWIRMAAVGRDGALGEVLKTPTHRQRPPEEIVEDIASMISEVEPGGEHGISAVGIGVPTTIDRSGRLDPCPNLPTMGSYPLKDVLTRRLGKPVFLDNDARCFALGEWKRGAGSGARVLVGVTLGTGIGLGIVVGGRVLRGACGRAGEVWRSPAGLEGHDTNFRNVESFASGTALQEMYERECGARLSGEKIASRASLGDKAARAAFERFGTALGKLLLWLADVLDPDCVVLGGAVAESFAHFSGALRRTLGPRDLKVVKSSLGQAAALYGAAEMALCEMEGRQ